MDIKVYHKTGKGEICFSWKERYLILTRGKIKMEKETTKTFINIFFDALIKLNHVLPNDIKNRPTDISKDNMLFK